MELHLEYEISAAFVLLVIIGAFFLKERLYQINSKVFAGFLLLLFSELMLDMWTCYVDAEIVTIKQNAFVVLTMIHYMNRILLGWMFAVYGMCLVDLFNKKNQKLDWLVSAPGILGIAYIMSGLVFQAVNSFSSGGSLIIQGRIVEYTLDTFYIIICMFFILKESKKVNRLELAVMLLMPAGTLLAVLLQRQFIQYRIVIPAVTLATLMIYMTFQNPDIYRDGLTGLYRRKAFIQIIENCISNHQYVELLIVDLNDMKAVNELLGVHGADKILQSVADYLLSLCNDRKELFRIDGDKFIFLLNREDEELARTVKARFEHGWEVHGGKMKMTASISRVALSKYVQDSNMIMKFVEKMVSYTKKQGRGSYVDATDEISEELIRSLNIEKVIRNLKEEEVMVYYQPIYSISKDRIIGMESLVRIQNEQLGLLFPDEFISIAEQTGVINRLGMIVLEKTCRFIQENKLCEKGLEFVDVNLSTIQCLQSGLADKIEQLLEKYQIPPQVLVLEITESAVISSKARVNHLIDKLSAQGVRFSMDDYGSGYSNSGSIIDLQLKTIKLDKLMLWDSMDNEKAKVIYINTVMMFQKLNLMTVAEGAESMEHMEFLKSVNVDYVQGYYFSKPVPGNQILSMFA